MQWNKPQTPNLTLRLLMSYIYMEHLFLMFLDHTRRRTTVGRTPLDEWSAHRRDLYLTTHNTYNRQTSIPPGIWTHHLSRWAAADLRLRPCSHWDRRCGTLQDFNTGSAESIVACRQGGTVLYNNASAHTGHIAPQVVVAWLSCLQPIPITCHFHVFGHVWKLIGHRFR